MTVLEQRKVVKAKIRHCQRELKRWQPPAIRESLEKWLLSATAELATLPNGKKGFANQVHGRHVSCQGISA